MQDELKHFFKEASKSVRKRDAFYRKHKKILEEYEELEADAIAKELPPVEIAKERYADSLNIKETKTIMEDRTIELRIGKNNAFIFEKKIYGRN